MWVRWIGYVIERNRQPLDFVCVVIMLILSTRSICVCIVIPDILWKLVSTESRKTSVSARVRGGSEILEGLVKDTMMHLDVIKEAFFANLVEDNLEIIIVLAPRKGPLTPLLMDLCPYQLKLVVGEIREHVGVIKYLFQDSSGGGDPSIPSRINWRFLLTRHLQNTTYRNWIRHETT